MNIFILFLTSLLAFLFGCGAAETEESINRNSASPIQLYMAD